MNRKIYKGKAKKKPTLLLNSGSKGQKRTSKRRKQQKDKFILLTPKDKIYLFEDSNFIYRFGVKKYWNNGLMLKYVPYILKIKDSDKKKVVSKKEIKLVEHVFYNFERCYYCNTAINKGSCSLKATGELINTEWRCFGCNDILKSPMRRIK